MVQLAGRPLISYPLEAAKAAGLQAIVVAKPDTKLPPLDVPLLLEPDDPTHPLLGIITALEHHPTILAIPCDMPFLQPEDLAALAATPGDIAKLWPDQPFPSLYRRATLPQLRQALEAGRSVRATQAQSSLAPASITSTAPATQLAVNTLNDLAAAEARIRAR